MVTVTSDLPQAPFTWVENPVVGDDHVISIESSDLSLADGTLFTLTATVSVYATYEDPAGTTTVDTFSDTINYYFKVEDPCLTAQVEAVASDCDTIMTA